MTRIFVILAVLFVSVLASAEGLSFKLINFVGEIEPSNRIFLSMTPEGKFHLAANNLNEEVEAKVISDDRLLDGNILLDLGEGRKLEITSGFSTSSRVEHILTLNGKEITLHPNLSVQILADEQIGRPVVVPPTLKNDL